MSTPAYNIDGFYFRSGPNIQINLVSAKEILPLRHHVLRPNRPLESADFLGDDDPSTSHFAAYDTEGNLVACATLLDKPFIINPDIPTTKDFQEFHPELLSTIGMRARQLRGMAVHPDHHKKGIGSLLLNYIETHQSIPMQTTDLWCNARTHAASFYQNHGWITVTPPFDIPNVGPHVQMYRKIRQY
ncbi:hypothetical protein KS4_29160 [Poriferisphaera corsica]|uniref:N-acetyltransferase domain-containing protein n=2 Tax=Poriferisphaera corsica TaxID=2528020 RepID=A0A517YX96_9BACT|nr:hypothetical protein KS4_29160 [Poriferisphaera corsica]